MTKIEKMIWAAAFSSKAPYGNWTPNMAAEHAAKAVERYREVDKGMLSESAKNMLRSIDFEEKDYEG